MAWLQGNDGEAKRALHLLRGSVGMFGAKQFVALTVALESAIGLASKEDIEILFEPRRNRLGRNRASRTRLAGAKRAPLRRPRKAPAHPPQG